jgi:formate/nitrite transporter FocA (FNT family)
MAAASIQDRAIPTSDLRQSVGEEPAPKKASKHILRHEIEEGLDALERPAPGLFVSGLSAGLDIGFSLFLMAVALSHAEGALPRAVERLLVANLYSVGFIFVVLGRSELFTEQTTLAVLPTLGGRSSVVKLLRLWVVVWTANVLGAAAFAALAVAIGPMLGAIDPAAFGTIAHRLTDHPAQVIFLSGVLAGWMMGLLSWLVAAGRDTISQVVLVWLVTASIGFAGLHHAILGAVEVFAGAFAGQGVGPSDVGGFLLWATLGNILGGVVFVAILKYGLARPEAQAEAAESR